MILDARLRLSPACKLLANYKNGTGRRPWVVCSKTPAAAAEDPERRRRLEALESAGARVIQVAAESDPANGKPILSCL